MELDQEAERVLCDTTSNLGFRTGEFQYDGTKIISIKVLNINKNASACSSFLIIIRLYNLIGLLRVWSGSCNILIGDKYTCMF